MTAGEQLYKVLGPNGEPIHGGSGKYHLPRGKRPGKWMPKIDNIVPCKRGYHVLTVDQLLAWLGPCIWTVDVRGDRINKSDKSVVAQVRLVEINPYWNETTARLLACDYAKRVLPIFEKKHPQDTRPRQCIGVARRFAVGKSTSTELAAARDAARAAARDATEGAVWDAAWAAAGAAARAAAEGAVWDAARAAAWAAAGAAARAAERRWQINRLKKLLTGKLYARYAE